MSASYSPLSRCCTTSNCSCPTAPSSIGPPMFGRNTWIAPSSPSCASPCCSCLVRSGLRRITVMNSSGAKKGRPVNCSANAAVGDGVAQLHPAVGGETHDVAGIGLVHRLAPLAHEGDHAGGRSSLPVRCTLSFMPGVYLPEHMRTKAMRSRCDGSMLACTLNTTPAKALSSGWTSRTTGCLLTTSELVRGWGAAPGRPAHRALPSRRSC
jgi:hypothetical protein